MFWNKKDKSNKADKLNKAGDKRSKEGSAQDAKSAQLRQQAMANVRAARAEIGEEALDQIAAMMTRKQQSATEQAKAKIRSADADRVVDEILYMLDEEES